MRSFLARLMSLAAIGALYLFFPFLPLFASVTFLRRKYVLEYISTLRKLAIHIRAMREGPVSTYFSSVIGVEPDEAPAEIRGSCTQCGNCCMDHRCVFLESAGENLYQCGIYTSPFRKLSNCGAFPVSSHDIKRYACPSYYVVETVPIRFVSDMGELQGNQ